MSAIAVRMAGIVKRFGPVVANAGAELEVGQIRAHLSASLSKYKLPVDITILDQLPKNPVGKIDKPSLRKTLAAAVARP